MRQNILRKWMRHAIALLCALPCVMTWCESSAEQRAVITNTDRMSVLAAIYIGDASFAITGCLAAGMEGMDLFGCIVVACITALGGGTFRDIFLGRLPVSWMRSYEEIALVIPLATATFFLWPPLSTRYRLTSTGEWLFWADTLGMAVFAASGAATAVAFDEKLHLLGCSICGLVSCTFGGLTRDILTGRPPRILYSNLLEVYALPGFLGSFACSAVLKLVRSTLVLEAIMLGIWVTIHARVFAVNHDLRLPTFPAASVYSKQTRPRDIAAQLALDEERNRESELDGARGNILMDGANIRSGFDLQRCSTR